MLRFNIAHPAAYFLAFVLIASGLFGCARDDDGQQRTDSTLKIWAHAGQQAEREVIADQVARFNQDNPDVRVELTLLPEGSYNAQVQAAALANALPDVLEFDGPFLYNYVWQGQLRALDQLLTDAVKKDVLSSVINQGTYEGRLYAVGTFDSGLGLYASRKALEQAGVRIPNAPADAWTIEEFDNALAALAERDEDKAVLDLKLNYTGEWYTYAFSPVLQSAGADLIERKDFQRAGGVLNSPQAANAMRRLQSWFNRNYVDPNLDDSAFVAGRVALSWVGHWEYNRYREALGADLLILPLPDFGTGSVTGQGSWTWAITQNTKHPELAARFLTFLLQADEVLRMANANGAVPATKTAIDGSVLYSESGALSLFVDQLESIAMPRPQTPAYPIITSVFQRAFDDIRNGGDVKTVLDRAAAAIDQDIKDNQGYRSHQ